MAASAAPVLLAVARRLAASVTTGSGSGSGSTTGAATGAGSAISSGSGVGSGISSDGRHLDRRCRLGDRFGVRDRRFRGGLGHWFRYGLDEARAKGRSRRLWRLGSLGRLSSGLLGDRVIRKHMAMRQGDVAFARLALDELTRHDFLDGTGRALHIDARFLLEQIDGVLARETQQLGDLVDPDSGQMGSLVRFFGCGRL